MIDLPTLSARLAPVLDRLNGVLRTRRGVLAVALVAGTLGLASGAAGVALTEAEAQAPRVEGETAVFAGGCFWCVEKDFDQIPGVLATVSGYTGGTVPNPTYDQVSKETTGHYEAVRVTYDPSVVSYETLVERFWRTVDPTDAGGQFCDRGESYRTAIFVSGDAQRETAEASKAALEASGVLDEPIVTPVLNLDVFWPAETYHQDYYKKNPVRYRFYRTACGRDGDLKALWGDDRS